MVGYRLGNLRAERERQYLSVSELAVKAGVSRSTVIDAELGRVRVHGRTVRKLAEALGMQPWQLDGGQESRKS